jgi:hypothetical protein
MATSLREASLTEHGIRGLWIEYDLCSEINRDYILPFCVLQTQSGFQSWNRATALQRRQAELRYEAAARIIDLFKTDRIPYRVAVARIQELFS